MDAVVGGNGGNGGAGALAGGGGGGGGGGGSGLLVRGNNNTITTTAATGGNGGSGGAGIPDSGSGGSPGAGIAITGTGNTVLVSGTVAPGTGATTSDAIHIQTAGNTVELNGATVNGSVRTTGVAGNTLRGTGTINGSVLLGAGTIAPGHSIGTLTAPFFDLSGATYNAEIDAAALTADLIDATGPSVAPSGGSVWISGATLNISNLAGTPAMGQVYTLVRANPGGINGTFTLGSLPPGVSATLSYLPAGTPTSVVLSITAVAPAAPAGTAAIPTLSEWGLGALSLLLAGGALWQRRRMRAAAPSGISSQNGR